MKKQSLEWFQEKELSSVICTIPNPGTEKEVDIMSKRDAQHYFDMQDRGYTFKSCSP